MRPGSAIADGIAEIVLAIAGAGKAGRKQLRGARGIGRRIERDDVGLLAPIGTGEIALVACESNMGAISADLRPDAAASDRRAVGVRERDDLSCLRVVNENVGHIVIGVADAGNQIVGGALEHH